MATILEIIEQQKALRAAGAPPAAAAAPPKKVVSVAGIKQVAAEAAAGVPHTTITPQMMIDVAGFMAQGDSQGVASARVLAGQHPPGSAAAAAALPTPPAKGKALTYIGVGLAGIAAVLVGKKLMSKRAA